MRAQHLNIRTRIYNICIIRLVAKKGPQQNFTLKVGDCEIELRCQERDSVGKYGRALGELWVFEDGIWTNVNKWMCDNAYAVPYVGQNKDDVKEQHMVNRRLLADRGELVIKDN